MFFRAFRPGEVCFPPVSGMTAALQTDAPAERRHVISAEKDGLGIMFFLK